MKHFVIVTTSFPDAVPGAESAGSFVSDLAIRLCKKAEVTVVAPGRCSRVEESGTFRAVRFAVPSMPLSLLRPSNPASWLKIWRTLLAGRHALDGVLRGRQVDHVVALWALPSGWWAREAGRVHGVPYSTWTLGSDIWTLGRIPLVRGTLRSVLRDSFQCFADGIQLQADTERIGGVSCEFLPSVRELVVDASAKILKEFGPYRLVFIGRWHRNKGVDLLLDALEGMDAGDLRLVDNLEIVGGGPMEVEVVGRVRALAGRGLRVSCRGYVDKATAREILLKADYVMIPSRIESIPVIFSDAMQARCPVLAAPVGDLPRLLQEFDVGVLADGVDGAALRNALNRLLRRAPASFCAGMAAAISRFRLDQVVERIVRLAHT